MLRHLHQSRRGGLGPLRGPMAGHRAAPGATGAPVAGRRRALELVAHLVRVGGGPARATSARGPRARDRGPVARSRCGVERALCRWFAERVIAVSYAVAAQLDPANVVVLDEYLDPAEFAPSHAGVFRARVGLAGDAAVIGAVARLDPLKGLDTLVDACAVVRADRPDAELVVIGSPVLDQERYAEEFETARRPYAGDPAA